MVISGGNDSQQASAGTGSFSQAGVGKWEFSQCLFFFGMSLVFNDHNEEK